MNLQARLLDQLRLLEEDLKRLQYGSLEFVIINGRLDRIEIRQSKKVVG